MFASAFVIKVTIHGADFQTGHKPVAFLHIIILRGVGLVCPSSGPNKGALVQFFVKEGGDSQFRFSSSD
jgi:hypothetical protein